jgi:predicted ArsR family transcriptional regulator
MDAPTVVARLHLEDLPIALERALFLGTTIQEIAGMLQGLVGEEASAGFLNVVGRRVADRLNGEYRTALGQGDLSREQVGEVLVDLERRIEGAFTIEEEDDEKIVLVNRACPFGKAVEGKPALCTMTSNLFGVIAAENLGYAKVVLQETIARGDAGCRVVVHLRPTAAARAEQGREFYEG